MRRKKIGWIALFLIINSGIPTIYASTLNSQGSIEFPTPTDLVPPLDSNNPKNILQAVDSNQLGTSQPLSIDYISKTNFGNQKITKVDRAYFASPDQLYAVGSEENVSDTTVEGPIYLQISDRRGTLSGWNLFLKQNDQFRTNDGDELNWVEL